MSYPYNWAGESGIGTVLVSNKSKFRFIWYEHLTESESIHLQYCSLYYSTELPTLGACSS